MLADLSLQSWPIEKRTMFPFTGGVYMVFAGALCLYVGQTGNFRRRFSAHDKAELFLKHEASYVVLVACELKERKQSEHFLIHTLKPVLNRWPAGNWRF